MSFGDYGDILEEISSAVDTEKLCVDNWQPLAAISSDSITTQLEPLIKSPEFWDEVLVMQSEDAHEVSHISKLFGMIVFLPSYSLGSL